jgi:hypothetical protein
MKFSAILSAFSMAAITLAHTLPVTHAYICDSTTTCGPPGVPDKCVFPCVCRDGIEGFVGVIFLADIKDLPLI